MKSQWKLLSQLLILSAIAFLVVWPGNARGDQTDPTKSAPVVGVSESSESLAVRDMPDINISEKFLDREINPRMNRNTFLQGLVELPNGPDDVLMQKSNNPSLSPSPSLSFDGITYSTGGTGSPPDTVGDVGPNHYVQSVNGSFQIFNKSGVSISGPKANNTIWSGFGGPCATRNDGDPIVLYDQLADRWLISQFTTASPYMICVAISTTPDPTGTYHRYGFNVGSELADYFKFGVWPNAYYMSANESTYTAYAFDRAKMLAGQTATFVKFTGQTNLLLPADIDGPTAPASNAPGIFYTFKDNSYSGHGGGSDRLEIFELNPNFVTPASSTFTLKTTIPVSSYTYTVCGFFVMSCVPQQGTTAKLDAMSEWPMFRFAYRNFGSYEAAVGTFTVDVGSDRAGLRWFELRKSGAGSWGLHQEGTYAPGSDHRFNSSIAMDKVGNIALGYTASSSTLYPSLKYAIRLAGDPLGTLQTEATLVAGGGSQTASHSRWGDYSAMSVDPSNDCTFWYTSEYYSTSGSSWKTRIGNFTIPGCTSGATPTPTPVGPSPTPTATPTATPTPITGGIVNGTFESGRNVGWTEYSSNGSIIVSTGSAYAGTYKALLGGAHNQTTRITQNIVVPSSNNTLYFRYRITSSDSCGYDYARVYINSTVVKTYNLCSSNATTSYVQGSVSLSAYAGQSVTLKFEETTDVSIVSTFALDNVGYSTSFAASGDDLGVDTGIEGDKVMDLVEPKPDTAETK